MKQRLVGVTILLACLVFYDIESDALADRLLIPVAAALGAWIMVQNAAAVCLVASLLAFAHTELGSEDWVVGIAYPVLAAVCGVGLLGIIIHRFGHRIAETHDARWQNRKRGSGEDA